MTAPRNYTFAFNRIQYESSRRVKSLLNDFVITLAMSVEDIELNTILVEPQVDITNEQTEQSAEVHEVPIVDVHSDGDMDDMRRMMREQNGEDENGDDASSVNSIELALMDVNWGPNSDDPTTHDVYDNPDASEEDVNDTIHDDHRDNSIEGIGDDDTIHDDHRDNSIEGIMTPFMMTIATTP